MCTEFSVCLNMETNKPNKEGNKSIIETVRCVEVKKKLSRFYIAEIIQLK